MMIREIIIKRMPPHTMVLDEILYLLVSGSDNKKSKEQAKELVCPLGKENPPS